METQAKNGHTEGRGAGVPRHRGKRLDRGRRATISTSDGPIVVDLTQCDGHIRFVPISVPDGVIVKFEEPRQDSDC